MLTFILLITSLLLVIANYLLFKRIERLEDKDRSFSINTIRSNGDFTFNKVLSLPINPDRDAFYFVQNGRFFEMYITDKNGVLFPLSTSEMINEFSNLDNIKIIDEDLLSIDSKEDLNALKLAIIRENERLGLYEKKPIPEQGIFNKKDFSKTCLTSKTPCRKNCNSFCKKQKIEKLPKKYNAIPVMQKHPYDGGFYSLCTGNNGFCNCMYKCEKGLLSHIKPIK